MAGSIKNGAVKANHLDHLGNRVAATHADGSIWWRETYAPFGERLIATENLRHPGFTSHFFDDATGLTYMQARYYDPVIGRFLSTDPVGYQDQFNLYAYVHNDPINQFDPNGENSVALQRFGARAGAAALISQADSPVPGPADAVALGVLAVSAVALGYDVLTNDDATAQDGEGSTQDDDGAAASPELKDMKKLSKGRIKDLGKRGFDAEATKEEVGMGGKEDLFADKDGNIFAGAKDGTGEATPTGENVNEIMDRDIEQ